MSPPRDRGNESSAPQVNPFELGRLLGENAAALARMRDALALADAANRWEELAQETLVLAGRRRSAA